MVGNIKVVPLANCKKFLGGSPHADYIIRYAKEIGAVTALVEDGYIDKDYLIDFSRFYSRSFGQKKAETTRIHFFNKELSRRQLTKNLFELDTSSFQKSYLGFTVVKPYR